VGAGPERERLEKESADLPAIVHFFGACYDEHLLGKLIANADLCLSPGEVGLTAIHCLSFGTPICTHGTLSEQMPEAEAIQSGITGAFFDKELGNIAEVIVEWLDSKPDRQAVRQACYRQIDTLYNPTNQYRIFTEGLRFLLSQALES
ncbi:MAG: glycosyltransferase family 1 protein, partial [Planctomycetota bacterium]